MKYLVSFHGRIGHAKKLLTDPSKTAFFFVTLPEALPIAVIRRFINWFTDFGIPVGGVVVNGLITEELLTDDVPAFVRNRIAMQRDYMGMIRDEFGTLVRGIVPLYEDELRGVGMLERAATSLF
jgi:arsenite-transporting ATPase